MDTEYMRARIAEVYDGPMWKERVRRMHSYQVIAIYHDFKARGRFDKPKRKPNLSDYERAKDVHGEVAIQLTMDDLLKGEIV